MLDQTSNTSIKASGIRYIPENVNLYPYLSGLENVDHCKLAGLNYKAAELSLFGMDYNNLLIIKRPRNIQKE